MDDFGLDELREIVPRENEPYMLWKKSDSEKVLAAADLIEEQARIAELEREVSRCCSLYPSLRVK